MTIIISTVLAVVSIVLALVIKTWLHPAVLFTTVWAGLCILPLTLAPDYPASTGAIAWITLSCLLTAAAAVLAARQQGLRRKRSKRRPRSINVPRLSTIVMSLMAIGVVDVLILITDAGIDPSSLGTAQEIAKTANKMSVLRYTPSYVGSVLGQVLLVFLFLLFLCAGMLHAVAETKREKIVAYLAFVPAVLSFVLQSTRTSLLYCGILWWAARTATNLCTRGYSRLMTIRTITIALMLAIAAPFIMGIGDVLRGGTTPDLYQISISFNTVRTRNAMLGHLGAFSLWFDRAFPNSGPLSYGAYTFGGLFQLLGIRNRTAGLYDSSESLASGVSTNIYTVFRGLLEDFGVSGSIMFLLALGIVGGTAYRKVLQGRQSAIPVLALFYAFTLWYVASIVTYNSVFFAFGLFSVYCASCARYRPQSVGGKAK